MSASAAFNQNNNNQKQVGHITDTSAVNWSDYLDEYDSHYSLPVGDSVSVVKFSPIINMDEVYK